MSKSTSWGRVHDDRFLKLRFLCFFLSDSGNMANRIRTIKKGVYGVCSQRLTHLCQSCNHDLNQRWHSRLLPKNPGDNKVTGPSIKKTVSSVVWRKLPTITRMVFEVQKHWMKLLATNFESFARHNLFDLSTSHTLSQHLHLAGVAAMISSPTRTSHDISEMLRED